MQEQSDDIRVEAFELEILTHLFDDNIILEFELKIIEDVAPTAKIPEYSANFIYASQLEIILDPQDCLINALYDPIIDEFSVLSKHPLHPDTNPLVDRIAKLNVAPIIALLLDLHILERVDDKIKEPYESYRTLQLPPRIVDTCEVPIVWHSPPKTKEFDDVAML